MEITENGKPLAKKYYTLDEKNKVLTVDKDKVVVIDVSDLNGCTIKCGWGCTINCGGGCTINCGGGCTINCGGDRVVVINRSYYEAIELNEGDKIKTFADKPHEKITDEPSLSGKEVEVKLDGKTYKAVIR